MTPVPVPYFLARPATDPPWPGVVVCLEGYGMDQWLLRVCERLAGEGYAAIAPDMFHRFGGSDRNVGPKHFMALKTSEALADIAECVTELKQLGATKIGVTGFCMGGRLTYEAATKGAAVDAAAGFYGAQISTMLAEPACPLLLLFGGTDEYIPPDEIAAVEAHHEGQVVVYPDAGHGFMRDGTESYDEAAATDAWSRLLAFFGEHLR
jgi:carboxymethylenebutenolidase